MKNCRRTSLQLALFLSFFYSLAGAHTLTVTGTISEKYVDELIGSMEKDRSIDTVRIQMCSGGAMDASIRLANYIRERKLSTFLVDFAASGCTLAYFGGVRRSITTTGLAVLSFHGASTRWSRLFDQPSRGQTLEVIREYERLSEGKFPGKFREVLLGQDPESKSIVFSRFPGGGGMREDYKTCAKYAVVMDQGTCSEPMQISFVDFGLISVAGDIRSSASGDGRN
jgi:hypothetical protein